MKQELANKEHRSISLPFPSAHTNNSVEDTKLSRALSATQQMLNLTNMINNIPNKVEPSKSEYYTIVCNVPESSSDDEKEQVPAEVNEEILEGSVEGNEDDVDENQVVQVEENICLVDNHDDLEGKLLVSYEWT